MIKHSSRQTGSAHIIIISLVILVIAGVLGFVYWNSLMKKNSTLSKTESKTTQQTDNSAAKKAQSEAQELKISDWSIKFTVPDGLKLSDVYYYKTHVGEGPDYYGFTTDRVRAQGGYCDNEVTGNLVTITRSTSKTGEGTLINNNPIDGYYFYSDNSSGGLTPTPECLTTDAANSDRTLMNQMVKTLSSE